MAHTIQVKAAGQPEPDGGARVVLAEQHPDHPLRETPGTPGTRAVYIVAGDGPVEVALTPAVAERLRDGRLEQVGGKNALAAAASEPPSDADLTVKTDAEGRARAGR